MKNSLQIAGGVVGAVLGLCRHSADAWSWSASETAPTPSCRACWRCWCWRLLGAIAGLVLGTTLAMLPARRAENTGTLLGNSLKALGRCRSRSAWRPARPTMFYAVATATPWLNPNAANPLLVFEVRLPAGAALPNSARDVAIELQTDINRMPGEPRFNQFRKDGDRPVGRRRRRTRLPHRTPAIGDQGQRPARPALPHRPVRQGAACFRVRAMAAIRRR